MNVQLAVQSTPNPNALKFVLNLPVKTEGNITYKNASECKHNSLAKAIFGINRPIKEVYFFDNYITVTQDGTSDWDQMEDEIRRAILKNIENHDPNFKMEEPQQEIPKTASCKDPDIEKINAILDETVRPALQMDGGDLQVIDYADNTVKIFYQGACGSCPSATMGTMRAIENLLRDQFNPNVTVELADPF